VNSDQPATPQPPHALGALTTSELSRYRRDLERALNDRTIGTAPVAETIRTRLAAVRDEEIQRSQIRNAGRTWPVSN
jgi:hypothetical protein